MTNWTTAIPVQGEHMNKETENPDPALFTTFEQLEIIHRVEVTEEKAHVIARRFGWKIDYADDDVKLLKGNGHGVYLGDWVDHRGSRWNPDPLTQGYHPAGTYRKVTS